MNLHSVIQYINLDLGIEIELHILKAGMFKVDYLNTSNFLKCFRFRGKPPRPFEVDLHIFNVEII